MINALIAITVIASAGLLVHGHLERVAELERVERLYLECKPRPGERTVMMNVNGTILCRPQLARRWPWLPEPK